MAKGVIIEGVTGTGKTQTLKALSLHDSSDVFREKETLGDAAMETSESENRPEFFLRRLLTVLKTIERRADMNPNYRFVLERFHYSYYVLVPNWSLYQEIDDRLAVLGARAFMFTISDDLLLSRSLYRADRSSKEYSQGYLDAFGSESGVISIFQESQHLRSEALARSSIPYQKIDTSRREWNTYALAIEAVLETR